VTELAASLDTSTTTIVAALSELRALGLVSQATGKSSYYAGDGDPPGGDKQKRPRTEPTQAQYAGMLGQRYLTISEVAAIVRLSKMTIYRLAWEGKLAGAIQVGRALRVPESGVQEYLKGCLITSQGTGLEEFISAMDAGPSSTPPGRCSPHKDTS
jgi:excisionase family DNA binding protein